MSKIVVFTSVSLDGVMQAPGRPDEDTRGGFTHGGWANAYSDEVIGRMAAEGMTDSESLLFGRRTYEDFYSVWPGRKDNPFTDLLNNTQKFVVSRTLKAPLPWQNSTLLLGDAADSVAELKTRPGRDIVVLGSGDLVQTLQRHGLVDRYILLIHPLILGGGRRLFNDGAPYSAMDLEESRTSTTGVVIATYVPSATT